MRKFGASSFASDPGGGGSSNGSRLGRRSATPVDKKARCNQWGAGVRFEHPISIGVFIAVDGWVCAHLRTRLLYRQEDAYEILEPSLKKGGIPNRVHDAMRDLALIGLYHTVSLMLNLESPGIQTSYIPFDQWVRRFMSLTIARPGGMLLTTEAVSRSDFDISQSSDEEFAAICELFRTSAPVSDAAPGYITRFGRSSTFLRKTADSLRRFTSPAGGTLVERLSSISTHTFINQQLFK